MWFRLASYWLLSVVLVSNCVLSVVLVRQLIALIRQFVLDLKRFCVLYGQ